MQLEMGAESWISILITDSMKYVDKVVLELQKIFVPLSDHISCIRCVLL